MITFIRICSISPATCQTKGRDISISNDLLLPFRQLHLRLWELKFIDIFRQAGQGYRSNAIGIYRCQRDFLFSRIIHNVFQHIQLLFHCLCIVILHLQIFQIDIDSFQIDFHRHSVIEESLCNISQFLQTGDISFYQHDLFGRDLSEIIHLTDLKNNIFPGFSIRQTTDFFHHFSYGHRSIKSLIEKRHLHFQSCISRMLQRLRYIIRNTVRWSVCDGHRRIKIVTITGYRIYLRQQLRTVFRYAILTSLYFFTFSF